MSKRIIVIPPVPSRQLLCAAVVLFTVAHVARLGQAQQQQAAAIYQDKCARCHGQQGEGVPDKYPEPLGGSHGVAELARLVEETMPKEAPQECVGETARLVAAYIHRQFYRTGEGSGTTRLARLTVDQYRNAVADTIGTFAPSQPPSDSDEALQQPQQPTEPAVPGLRGEYFQSRGMSKADKLGHYRSDTHMAFDFGEGSPAASITADQFSIIWQGGLIANDTGHYEFRVRSENGVRLYLNLDPHWGLRKLRDDSSAAGQTALIDAWVGSGEMRERSARVFLLGGRIYPIRLEYFKYLEKTGSVVLEWRPPHGVWSVLDYQYTTTDRPARVYVCETPFPADDQSLGYLRGSSVSPEWQAATTDAAVEASTEVVSRLPLLAGFDETTTAREEKVKEFVLRFAQVAFRRPLTSSENRTLEQVVANAQNLETGVRRAVVMILLSPHFLYPDLTPAQESPTPFTIASRLSFGLWDSIPDEELLDAARSGKLQTTGQIEAQARRMMGNPRARAKMRSFFHSWLELDERDLAKDRQKYPDFDEAVVADLRRSLELFLEQVVWSRASDYRQLLLADYLVLNQRLRKLYQPRRVDKRGKLNGQAIKSRARQIQFASDFQPVRFPSGQRSGVLTHPYLLSAYAYHNNTSPIHRGVFLTRNIVGRALNPPPMAIVFKDEQFASDLTMREKVTQLTRDTACMSCHSVINPLGFTLENFDAVGRWRATDNNKQVDTASQYTTVTGETLRLESARDVAKFAASSESAQRAFITHVFQHIVKRNPSEFDPSLLEGFTNQFAKDDFSVRRLWVRIAAAAATHSHAETSPSTD